MAWPGEEKTSFVYLLLLLLLFLTYSDFSRSRSGCHINKYLNSDSPNWLAFWKSLSKVQAIARLDNVSNENDRSHENR